MKSTDAELLGIAADAREEGRVELANRIAREAIRIPAEGAGHAVVASVSGGKDSTALILALREAQIPCEYVFADTGWEARETYDYLELLQQKLSITIDRVQATPKSGVPAADNMNEQGRWSAAVDRFRYRAGFPGRISRFCTRELKLEPLRAYHDALEERLGVETISAIGVRAQESERRSTMPEWEDEGPRFTRHRWGGFVWRPLIQWTVEDVLLIHRRHGIPVNPLYQRGHDRVGCYPCIFSNKEEIKMIAQHAPERMDLIEKLEVEIRVLRQARNDVEPGRYKHADDASFFQTQRKGYSGIRKVIDWAQTSYGGKQMQIFAEPPQGGCMKWGLCDIAPTKPSLPDGDTTGVTPVAEIKRYFRVEFDCISFSIVASSLAHVEQLLREYYKMLEDNFDEKRAAGDEPEIVEISEEAAAEVQLFDDARDGKLWPFTTFEMGAVASSEY